jgi:hypothetical protein
LGISFVGNGLMPRCSANLGYLDEKDKGAPNPLDSICYMWWDALPIHGATAGPDLQATANTILDVLMRILSLNSDACRESALHGLSHWSYYDSNRIEDIVNRFLITHYDLRPELLTYAHDASEGDVR